ncbi:MFS transporter [Paenibacillus tarimensis]
MSLSKRAIAIRMLGYLWILGFVAAISRFVIAYYQQEISDALVVNRAFLSSTWAFNMALTAVCSPVGGRLTDRYGPRKMMILNAVFGILAMLVVLIFRNPWGFFIGLGCLSGLTGIGASTSYVLVTRWFSAHRAKALMVLSSASSLGLAILTPLFISNGNWLDWTTAYTITLWIGVCSIPFTFWLIKDRSGTETEEPSLNNEAKLPEKRWVKLFSEYFRNPVTVVVMIALFTCGFSMGTVEMHLMAIHQHAHVGNAVFASSLSLLGLLELGGGMLFAFLLDRMSRTLALASLYVLRVIAFIALILHFEVSPILFSILFGASYLGAIPGGILVAGEALGQKSMGLHTGTLLLFHQGGAVIGALSGGVLFDWTSGYQMLIGINILLSCISAAGYSMVYYTKKQIAKKGVLAG